MLPGDWFGVRHAWLLPVAVFALYQCHCLLLLRLRCQGLQVSCGSHFVCPYLPYDAHFSVAVTSGVQCMCVWQPHVVQAVCMHGCIIAFSVLLCSCCLSTYASGVVLVVTAVLGDVGALHRLCISATRALVSVYFYAMVWQLCMCTLFVAL